MLIYLRRFRPFWFFVLAVLSTVLVLVAVSCSNTSSTNADNVFRVATSPSFPPFEFKADDGTLQGFDIDLMTAIAQTQNVTIEFESMSFEDVIRSLLGNNIDASISGISITSERAESVSFSRPYFQSGLAIAVSTSTSDISSVESLSGKIIGSQQGTTGAAYAQTIPNSTIKLFTNSKQSFDQLAAGKLDAVINDYPVIEYSIRQGLITNIKSVDGLLTQEYYGIAVPKDSDTLDVINTGLTTLIENGQYAEIYSKWFEPPPPQLPQSVPGAG